MRVSIGPLCKLVGVISGTALFSSLYILSPEDVAGISIHSLGVYYTVLDDVGEHDFLVFLLVVFFSTLPTTSKYLSVCSTEVFF